MSRPGDESTPKAAIIHEKGGPDVLRLQDDEVGVPGPSEVRIEHIAIGVNNVHTYHRSGYFSPRPAGDPPVVVGFQAAVEVKALDSGIEGFRIDVGTAGPAGAASWAW